MFVMFLPPLAKKSTISLREKYENFDDWKLYQEALIFQIRGAWNIDNLFIILGKAILLDL